MSELHFLYDRPASQSANATFSGMVRAVNGISPEKVTLALLKDLHSMTFLRCTKFLWLQMRQFVSSIFSDGAILS
jgi:hypothetical protein